MSYEDQKYLDTSPFSTLSTASFDSAIGDMFASSISPLGMF